MNLLLQQLKYILFPCLSLLQLSLRICSIVGGIFATSRFLEATVSKMVTLLHF
ncbi:unnamed protein product [Meloidogyne enterolobii]|uniref:Uncharacterized protein n=1 Tax=Meloidogyne enterolobii TaxID=390850 RepID=A0ACB0ZLU4_MELEN